MTGEELLPLALLLLAAALAVTLWAFVAERPPSDPSVPTWPARRSDPPRDVPVLVGAHVVGWRRRSTSAQVADLVVRGALRVVPGDVAQVEVVDLTGLAPVERGFVAALVGHGEPRAGDRAVLSGSDHGRDERLRELQAAVNTLVVREGWRRVPSPPTGRVARRVAMVVVVLLSVPLLRGGWLTGWATMTIAFMAVLTLLPPRLPHVLSDRGVVLRDHLHGLRDHLRLGDREDTRSGTAAHAALLPWAVLFAQVPAWCRGAGSGAEEQADLLALLRRLQVDRPGYGTGPEQSGDPWGEVATGGSRAEHDGAFVRSLD
ncbi:hypothetical protein GC089_11310 [Cellulomonas sp. JZ18]|uniref:DUF2207 domain-containing protein n=1 Tax=Cellulomonas sp. JZ18 TaxID=2654191 RepID=UPI0012D3EB2E|nr:DUF2207 domain-containing protein [Cellulomonas sp. JZ18]QGQ19707.1 hypothetical protein GC089_11310 [Cellulomonas sp. JZ18]